MLAYREKAAGLWDFLSSGLRNPSSSGIQFNKSALTGKDFGRSMG
jgi:hypothetical protein